MGFLYLASRHLMQTCRVQVGECLMLFADFLDYFCLEETIKLQCLSLDVIEICPTTRHESYNKPVYLSLFYKLYFRIVDWNMCDVTRSSNNIHSLRRNVFGSWIDHMLSLLCNKWNDGYYSNPLSSTSLSCTEFDFETKLTWKKRIRAHDITMSTLIL